MDHHEKLIVEDFTEKPLCNHEIGASTRDDWDAAYFEFLRRARMLKMCSTCAITGAMYLAMHAAVTNGMTEEDAVTNVRRIYRDVKRQFDNGTVKKQE